MRILKRAFTLIELLVVIAIIGILTAIIVPNFMGARERADDSKRVQDMEVIKTALRMYYNDNQNYPAVSEWKNALNGKIGSVNSLDGYTYDVVNNGDGFTLYSLMEAMMAENLKMSRLNCGILSDAPEYAERYYVCAF